MTPALILAFTLMTALPPASDGGGEPLPPGAPTESYELAAWCYGALGEYLTIYDKVKPDLRDIDHMFGTSVVEDEPYQSDMAAARVELKVIGDAVTDAEKASPRPIADRGVAAIRQGETIWSLAEAKPHRELARAWMLWALPDACDSNARQLAAKSLLLGGALSYNTGSHDQAPAASAPRVAAAPAQGSIRSASEPLAAAVIATPAPAPETPPPVMAAETPPPVSPLPASPPPVGDLVASPAAPPVDAEAAAPEPSAAPSEVVSVQPTAPAPAPLIAAAPMPAARAEQTPTLPTGPPDADQPQEPTL